MPVTNCNEQSSSIGYASGLVIWWKGLYLLPYSKPSFFLSTNNAEMQFCNFTLLFNRSTYGQIYKISWFAVENVLVDHCIKPLSLATKESVVIGNNTRTCTKT